MIKDMINDSNLIIECEYEDLSDIQIDHRKKQLANLVIIKGALQHYLNAEDVGGNITNSNGNLQSVGVENGTYKIGKLTTATKKDSNVHPNKRKFKAYSSFEPPSKKKNTATPEPSLTQTLRATRKSSGILPKVCYTEEPEIEIIEDTRPPIPVNKISSPAGGVNQLGYRSIASKPSTSTVTPQSKTTVGIDANKRRVPAVKPNNMLLLNINVRPRNGASVVVNAARRKDLDAQVKIVLMKSPTEFIEWLLKQSLIRAQQNCSIHVMANRQPTKYKLGVFQDPKTLANSGGYVWIGDCCSKKYVSVFSGSMFGQTPVEKVQATSLLKLIYHWSCQTSISNVETWVKVDKTFVSRAYNYLRCLCSLILHDKVFDFGFEGSSVELGIVSLGTTTSDGSKKAVKVEILGLFDRKKKSYRLFASSPGSATTSKERFLRILKPVKDVVHRNATIICDQSVDPSCLHSLHFPKVEVCKASDDETNMGTNSIIMHYLRKHVPKMFQSALSQLTENQVQLVLDELCWREKFAATSAMCYTNILENIAYVTTREMENPGVIPLLEYVADNPHVNFRYKTAAHLKVLPSVPMSVIIAPSTAPLIVNPSQQPELKVTSPMSHSNKILSNKYQPIAETKSYSVKPMTTAVVLKKKGGNNFMTLTKPLQAIQPSPKSDELFEPARDIDSYFYGGIEGNSNFGQDHNDSIFKCHLCSDTYDDNVNFYTHIKYHIEGVVAPMSKLECMCPYCFKYFENESLLLKHKIDTHLMSDSNQMWCRICSVKFKTEYVFKNHMIASHVEEELPYRCEICHFATSFYFEIINHFQKKHRGTPYVQCHICLNVKTITPNGAGSFSTRLFQHLHKHMQTKLKCSTCVLSFYSKYLLVEHKKEHISCVNVNG